MAWKDLAVGLGTKALMGELKAIERSVSKRQYKRLLSTTLAQLLSLDPDTKTGKARRWARKAVGVKPSKKVLRAARDFGLKETAEAVAVTAASAGIAKIARKVAPRVGNAASRAINRVKGSVGESDDEA